MHKIPTWEINPHIKGDTFGDRKITFPFDITNCKIQMYFKKQHLDDLCFDWCTDKNTFEKISSSEVVMKSKILDYDLGTYFSNLKVTFENGTIITYLKANLQII